MTFQSIQGVDQASHVGRGRVRPPRGQGQDQKAAGRADQAGPPPPDTFDRIAHPPEVIHTPSFFILFLNHFLCACMCVWVTACGGPQGAVGPGGMAVPDRGPGHVAAHPEAPHLPPEPAQGPAAADGGPSDLPLGVRAVDAGRTRRVSPSHPCLP